MFFPLTNNLLNYNHTNIISFHFIIVYLSKYVCFWSRSFIYRTAERPNTVQIHVLSQISQMHLFDCSEEQNPACFICLWSVAEGCDYKFRAGNKMSPTDGKKHFNFQLSIGGKGGELLYEPTGSSWSYEHFIP